MTLRIRIVYFLLLCIVVSCSTGSDSSNKQNSSPKKPFELTRHRDRATNLYGFKDQNDSLVIACQFDKVQSFKYGRAIVEKNGDHYFIDEKGQRTSKVYTRIGYESTGLRDVYFSDSTGKQLMGLIDSIGQELIAGAEDYQWGKDYIIASKTVMVKHKFGRMIKEKHKALVDRESFEEGKYYRGIKLVGSPVVGFILDSGSFAHSENWLTDIKGRRKSKKYHWMNWHNLSPFLSVSKRNAAQDALYGLLDMQGNEVVRPQFESKCEVVNGFIVSNDRNNSTQKKTQGLLDIEGNKILPANNQAVNVLEHYVHVVKNNGSYAYYTWDENKKEITKKSETYQGAFSHYANRNSRRLLSSKRTNSSAIYYYGEEEAEGLIKVTKNGKYGFIDSKTLAEVLPCEYANYKGQIHNNNVILEKDKTWYVFDSKLQKITGEYRDPYQ